MQPIILASASPRRQELLKQISVPFKVLPQNIDETFIKNNLKDEAIRLAQLKAESCFKNMPNNDNSWILGADTFIEFNNYYIGKPNNREDAFDILKNFSGQWHSVITGLAIIIPDKKIIKKTSVTMVKFSSISDKEINWYLDSNEWQGVAGAYRIQSLGGVFIKTIKGSYSNVMGLPINTFYGILYDNNYWNICK